ncbi:hypothetical protein Ddye_019759 [Dipteronia dyeriana]|uniref:N-acetyltransferase domain-containing protein n=1 Tax=Dipteronia dyeriana TaxID=168575 RepID=A0AAD9WUR2_9ROSI|nr:hypothetical protein Ddye_019759 [Dipteronia dyeriana]
MVDKIENKKQEEQLVVIREFNQERDIEVVGKLERNCEIDMLPGWSTNNTNYNNNIIINSNNNNKKRVSSLLTNMMAEDPLCRIRLYAVHVMLVAELRENGVLVGVVRGCIKCVGTKFGFGERETNYLNLGCILGLRVSPSHRRMGIGFNLVKSVEEWMMRNGAHYTFLATEKSNVASTNLFTNKCNYINFASLVIFVQPVHSTSSSSSNIKIEKLHIEQAISLYNNRLRSKHMYPTDIDSILKEKLSLGTWVSYFKEEDKESLINKNGDDHDHGDFVTKTPSSWVVFSVWNSCEAYKIDHIKNKQSISHPLKFFHATLSHAKEKIFPCLKLPILSCSSSGAGGGGSSGGGSIGNPFGFLFLYGLYGEGERLGELMKSVLRFASRLAENVKHCKVIMTELGVSDPLIEHVPQEPSISCIQDLWYLKKMNGIAAADRDRARDCHNDTDDDDELMMMGQIGNVFVDPRDF